LSESFVAIALLFLELLKKVQAAGKKNPSPGYNKVKWLCRWCAHHLWSEVSYLFPKLIYRTTSKL